MLKKVLPLFASLFAAFCIPVRAVAQTIPSGASIDAEISKIMSHTNAKGMAVAVVDHGNVGYVQAYGIRNANGDPLATDTVMYGASLTKTVFAYTVMQLVDQGKLNLDTPMKEDLDNPLPSYGPDPVFPDKHGPYKDLADDSRWEKITPRMCLTHSTGFNNFWFIEPDQKLHIHFEPGARFNYSGEGFILLQFVIEHGRKTQGLGLDVGDLTNAIFDRLGMTRTSLVWRDAFAGNLADGWNDQGQSQQLDRRKKVRVAGSMDTTISDLPKFVAALVRGDGLSAASLAEMTKPLLHLTTAHQFPPFLPDLPVSEQRKDLYAGLGVVVFDGPQGHSFYKGGHDGQTANTMICIATAQVASSSSPTMCAPRRASPNSLSLSSAIPVCPMTGNMETTPGSREFTD